MDTHCDKFTERTIGRKRVFDGRLVKVDAIDVELPDGRKSVREVVVHPGAAVILVRDESGQFVFVRQFRKAVNKVILEAVAGTLDEGEDPAECARRETAEESGLTVTSLTKLGEIYPAPGYTSEKLHIFIADAIEGAGGHKADEDENIERVALSESAIDGMVSKGQIEDAKTLAAWLLFKSRAGI